MSANILVFDVLANSGKGLMARPLLPNDVIAYQADISSISYEIINLTDGGTPVTGSLVVADVMSATLQPWKYDSMGFTFLWAAAGTLWPDGAKDYRVLVTFTINAPSRPYDGFVFTLAWQAKTTDPTK